MWFKFFLFSSCFFSNSVIFKSTRSAKIGVTKFIKLFDGSIHSKKSEKFLFSIFALTKNQDQIKFFADSNKLTKYSFSGKMFAIAPQISYKFENFVFSGGFGLTVNSYSSLLPEINGRNVVLIKNKKAKMFGRMPFVKIEYGISDTSLFTLFGLNSFDHPKISGEFTSSCPYLSRIYNSPIVELPSKINHFYVGVGAKIHLR